MKNLKFDRRLLVAIPMVVALGCGGTNDRRGQPSTDPAQDDALNSGTDPRAETTADPASSSTALSAAASAPDAASCPDWFLNPPRNTTNFYATATETDSDVDAAFARSRQVCLDKFEKEIVNNFRQLVAGVQFQRRLADDSELLAQFNLALEKAPDLALQQAAITERQDLAEGDLQRVCLLMELRRRAVDQAVYDVVVADEQLHAAAREGENFKVWEDYLQGKFDEE